MNNRLKQNLVLALLTAGLASPLRAADHSNLEEGLPTRIEDAYPIGFRGREFQTVTRYTRTDGNEDRVLLEPRLEAGIAPNAQAKIAVPILMGSADRAGSGDVILEALYNFNTEGLAWPAFSLAGKADFPTGRDSAGVDTAIKGLATKSLTRWGADRIHLNAAWHYNAANRSDERQDRYEVALGYSRRLDPDTVLVADVVREKEREDGHESTLLEAGLRRQITPLTLVTAGIGTGVGDESPDVTASLGFQKSF